MGLAVLQLLRGDFQRGLPAYEWRWKTNKLCPRDFRQPLWDGRPLEGSAILLHEEQGIGDTFQFIRYARLIKPLGGRVIVECQKPLLRLLSNCIGIDQLVERGRELPAVCRPSRRCSVYCGFSERPWTPSPPPCRIYLPRRPCATRRARN